MGDRAKALWERVSFWLALVVGGALIANAAVVVGDSVLGGVAVAIGLCVLVVIHRQSWGWFPQTRAGALGVAAVGFLAMGPFVGICGGALAGLPSFPDVRFEFAPTSAVLFGVINGGGWAWVRWMAFQEEAKEEQFAVSPERPGQVSG